MSIKSKVEETSPNDEVSDKYLEEQDRRYLCLKCSQTHFGYTNIGFEMYINPVVEVVEPNQFSMCLLYCF